MGVPFSLDRRAVYCVNCDINLYLQSVTALDQDRNTLLQTFGIKLNVKLCKVLQTANVLQYTLQLNKLPERLEVMYSTNPDIRSTRNVNSFG